MKRNMGWTETSKKWRPQLKDKQHHIANRYHSHCLCGLIYNFASSSTYFIFTGFATVYEVMRWPIFLTFLREMNLTECPGGVAVLAESTALGKHLCSAPAESKKAPCNFPCLCYCWQYFLCRRNCGGCCHISHLSLGTGRILQAAHLGWPCCVKTGSSSPWTPEL